MGPGGGVCGADGHTLTPGSLLSEFSSIIRSISCDPLVLLLLAVWSPCLKVHFQACPHAPMLLCPCPCTCLYLCACLVV